MSELPIDISVIVQAKGLLESIPDDNQNEEYKHIIIKMNNYITNNCKHHVVYDHIDINPECSKLIKYCEYCYTTFS